MLAADAIAHLQRAAPVHAVTMGLLLWTHGGLSAVHKDIGDCETDWRERGSG